MKTLFLGVVALASSWATAQDPEFDNTKLLPLIGDWTGNAALHEEEKGASTIKGTKTIGDRWIQLDLQFDTKEMGKIDARALLTTDSNGAVGGYFFAAMSSQPLFGKGKFEGKKLIITATSMEGGETLEFIFDLSVADELKFSLTETEQEKVTVMHGEYKRKK